MTASLKLNPVPVSAQTLKTFTIRWGLIAVGEPRDAGDRRPRAGQGRTRRTTSWLRIEAIDKPTAAKYVLTLNVLRDLAMPDPHEVVFREYEVELIDAEGQPFRVQSQTPSLTERGVQLRLTFPANRPTASPSRLKLHYPRLRPGATCI